MIREREPEVFWRVYARWYDALWDTELTRAVARRVAAQLSPDLPVVEHGAGTGLITRELAAAHRVVLACEPETRMRDLLFAKDLQVERVTGESIEDCQLPPGNYSIVAVNVLHLVTDQAACLERLRAMAGPRGRVVWVVPTAGATVHGVARAHRRSGAGLQHQLRFHFAHMVLGPLAIFALVRPSSIRRPADSLVSVVGGVQEIYVLDGSTDVPPT